MTDNKDLQTIELCFENVDSCKINFAHIKTFFMSEIKKGICVINTDSSTKSIMHFNYCDFFTVTIAKNANYTPFLDFGNLPSDRLEDGKKIQNSLFDRIMFNDMCSVCLHYTDNTTEEISLCWEEEHEYTNYYQETKINEKGDLNITIERKGKINDN